MEIDDRQASQIHGIISSDSDSDYNGRDFDDEYYALKPPPLDYQSIKDKIVVICREQRTNVWEERLKNLEKDVNETITGVASNVRVLTKKKKKKSKTKVGNNVQNGKAAVNCEKVQIQLPVLKKPVKKKTQIKPEQSRVKGSSPKVRYDPQTLKKVEEKISELKSVWHSGLNDTIIQQELSLQRQRESSLYESWMKSAGIEIKPKTKTKQEKTVVSEKKTEKNSKQPVAVQKKSSAYGLWMKLAGIKTKSKETKKEQENTVKNEKKAKKKSKQTVQYSTNLAKKGKNIKKNTPKKKAVQTLKNSKDDNTPESISTDFWWNYDSLVNDQSRLLPSFTNDTKNDTKFNKVKGTANTTTETEKKVSAKKTWAQLFEKPEENMTKQKSQVKTNIEEARKSFYDEEKWNLQLFGTEIIKNEIPEKDEMQNENGSDAQNSNFGLLDKETVQSVWYFNNFNFNDTQYLMSFSNDTERDSRFNINIEEANSTTKTKKKKRSRKKSKQSVDILTNQSLAQNLEETMPKHVKETWEMAYEEGKSNLQLFDGEIIENEVPEKEETQIVQKSNGSDTQNSNFVLLDKDTLRNVWRFDNFVDDKISCFTYISNDINFNIDMDEANSTPKTKKRTRSKRKSKKSVDNLTNQVPDGNDYTHSKEILDDQEKLNLQLLDEQLKKQVWFSPKNIDVKFQLATEIQEEIRNENFNHKDTNQDGVSAAPKPKTKKKKKPKQSPNEVGHDTEKTSEDTEYSGITRENWDFNSENPQFSINNNKEMTFEDTATSDEPRQVFGDDFKNFIQNICCKDPTVFSNLNSFNYEQLERSYLAYREKNFKDTSQVDVSAAPKSITKKKKKKPKQSTAERPLDEVGHDTEKTSEDTIEYRGITRENWDLNSEMTPEEPQQVSDEDFIRNICCRDVTNISTLNSFSVEQSYLAYREKKNATKQLNAIANDVTTKSKSEKSNIGVNCSNSMAKTRENWDLNSENLQVSINNNKERTFGDTATSAEPQEVFGDDFKDFIRNICSEDPTVISNFNSLNYEQLERSYLAYREENFKDTSQVDLSAVPKSKTKKKKKKPKQSTAEPPLTEVGHDTEKTSEDTFEYRGITRENWDLNSEDPQVSINNNKEMTFEDAATSAEPQEVFGDDFKDFIRNICSEDPTVISNFNSLNYEQLERSYLAYREKNFKDTSQVDVSAAPKTKKKKKKPKQSTAKPPLNEVGHDTEKTSEHTIEYGGITRENWDLNSEMTSEEPQQVSGEDFIRNICCRDVTNISTLNSFSVEQSYLAYREKKNATKQLNAIANDVTTKSNSEKSDIGVDSSNSMTKTEKVCQGTKKTVNDKPILTDGDRLLNSLPDGDRFLYSLTGGDRLLNSLTDGDRHSYNLTAGDKLLNSLTESYRHLNSLTDDDRRLNSLPDGERHLHSLTGGDRHLNSLRDGDGHSYNLTAGDKLLNSSTESYRHLNSLTDDDRHLNSFPDGDRFLHSLTGGDRLLNSLTDSDRLSNSLTAADRLLNSSTDDDRLLGSLTEPNDSFHPTNYQKHHKTDTNFDVTDRNPKNGTVIDPSTEMARFNPEDGAKTSVSLPESSQTEEKQSINSSTIVLKANSATGSHFNGISTTSKDFDESFAVFTRTYNDALGYDHISTYNADYYKKLYRILDKRTNKNSTNDTKKTVDDKPIANDPTWDSDRLLHYLTRSNDGVKSKSQVTSTYRTSTADSWYRHSDYRECIVSNENVSSITPFSRENQGFYGRSSRYGENYRRERENFGSVSHTVGDNRLGDLSNDRYRLYSDNTEKETLHSDDYPLPSTMLYVFIIVMVAIAVMNIIADIVSFLYNNIFFVGLLFFVFMKFKS